MHKHIFTWKLGNIKTKWNELTNMYSITIVRLLRTTWPGWESKNFLLLFARGGPEQVPQLNVTPSKRISIFQEVNYNHSMMLCVSEWEISRKDTDRSSPFPLCPHREPNRVQHPFHCTVGRKALQTVHNIARSVHKLLTYWIDDDNGKGQNRLKRMLLLFVVRLYVWCMYVCWGLAKCSRLSCPLVDGAHWEGDDGDDNGHEDGGGDDGLLYEIIRTTSGRLWMLRGQQLGNYFICTEKAGLAEGQRILVSVI